MIDQKFHVGDVAVYINEHGYYGKNYFKVRVLNAFQEEDESWWYEVTPIDWSPFGVVVREVPQELLTVAEALPSENAGYLICMNIIWYDINEDFIPDYANPHVITIKGKDPQDCMNQYSALKSGHDLSKFTRTEIIGIF